MEIIEKIFINMTS